MATVEQPGPPDLGTLGGAGWRRSSIGSVLSALRTAPAKGRCERPFTLANRAIIEALAARPAMSGPLSLRR